MNVTFAKSTDSYSLPITITQFKAMQAAVRKWKRERPSDPILDLQPESNSPTLIAAGADQLRLNGFDQLILARALIAPRVKVED